MCSSDVQISSISVGFIPRPKVSLVSSKFCDENTANNFAIHILNTGVSGENNPSLVKNSSGNALSSCFDTVNSLFRTYINTAA